VDTLKISHAAHSPERHTLRMGCGGGRRYGPWMDTNVVVPIAPDRCRVEFDYFVDPSHPQAANDAWVNECLEKSHLVQMEDTALCEGVQRGLESPAYDVGRYAPRLEAGMFHFHRQLERELQRELQQEPGSCYEYTND
jgi:choline monooxygenase